MAKKRRGDLLRTREGQPDWIRQCVLPAGPCKKGKKGKSLFSLNRANTRLWSTLPGKRGEGLPLKKGQRSLRSALEGESTPLYLRKKRQNIQPSPKKKGPIEISQEKKRRDHHPLTLKLALAGPSQKRGKKVLFLIEIGKKANPQVCEGSASFPSSITKRKTRKPFLVTGGAGQGRVKREIVS